MVASALVVAMAQQEIGCLLGTAEGARVLDLGVWVSCAQSTCHFWILLFSILLDSIIRSRIKEYLRLCQSDRTFDVAKGVVFNFDEGKALDPLNRFKKLGIRRRVLNRISGADRGNRGQGFLFKAHWTPNPFRPLQSVGEVPRYTSWTIDRTTPMKCPVPPVLIVSPEVVEFDHDKHEESKEAPKAKSGKPSSKEKAKRAPSGRSSRTKAVEKNNSDGPEKSKKNFSDATKVIASLSQRCGGYRPYLYRPEGDHCCQAPVGKCQTGPFANPKINLY
ncbi:hypothetical protein SeMB42_g04848 [Synchytrium endobioticum]|uniref:Uncharacterized protein n=1 Tax=Synchytrium endobioticum TaxID=286115 RepID=A0A507CMU5_9FUNG|nr:hypothetical protein SeLEV6574_g06654 [Synchytrium endobioticum]TPX43127.1 hypothetical protein SeMB42_g04848 [Synchytrium endobioticum]